MGIVGVPAADFRSAGICMGMPGARQIMTIKRRLLISHLAMFVMPLVMAAVIILSAAGAVMLFIKGGNHVYVESGDQYSHASEILYYNVFHGQTTQKGIDDTASYDWIVQALDPEQNLIILMKGDAVIYQYGNEALSGMIKNMPQKETIHEYKHTDKGTYISIDGHQFRSLRKRTIEGVPYYLYFVSHQAPHGTDDRLEAVSAGMLVFILVAIIAVIGFTSWFLADFMIRRLLPPLEDLKKGAEQIQSGDLDIHLTHEGKDEFSPVFSAFNLMAKELSASLKARELEERSRKELIASISHDIRTPLTAIKAYVEGLIDGVARTEEKKERYLKVIYKKTNELDDMIEQLFLLSKMDVGSQAVPMASMDLSPFLEGLVEENRYAFQQKGLSIAYTGPAHAEISGNPMLLERLLLNLWENSAKYKTGEMGHIAMALTADGQKVQLTVTDDGPGVPEEALPHLFEAFYRTDKARSQTGNGSGLGLAIVSRAMAMMHGRVHAENRKPHGLAIIMEWGKEDTGH